jgi:hypothetical protein
MKNFFTVYIIASFLTLFLITCSEKQTTGNDTDSGDSTGSIALFDEILFYDGYAEKVDYPVPTGVYRISNSKYVTKLTDENIEKIGDSLELEIIVRAACDNYDRIGNVFLSFVTKGEQYDRATLMPRIEVARFITPFMDKNKLPSEVPYDFEINNIAKILKDPELSAEYDFWIEFDIFGVPYAANEQISGCDGKNFTFFGTLNLISNSSSHTASEQVFIPIASSADFNNYSSTDVIGQTTRSFEINIPSSTDNARLYLITSNHGANAGGEEYNRRHHYVYFDGNLVDTYIPGGKSCEPFRQYNTQSNGIYGLTPRSEATWASFSNWCPGDVIPIRIYDLGNLSAGTHTFKIEVPEAVFVDGQGNIPLSAYIQGDKS